MLALVVIGVRRSAWSDYDVSDRGQRSGFYRALFVVLPAGSIALWFLQPALRAGVVSSWALVLASMQANRFVKSSLHVAFAVLRGQRASPAGRLDRRRDRGHRDRPGPAWT